MTYILAAEISLHNCCTVVLDCTEGVSTCFALCFPLQPLAIPDTMAEANRSDGMQRRRYEGDLPSVYVFCTLRKTLEPSLSAKTVLVRDFGVFRPYSLRGRRSFGMGTSICLTAYRRQVSQEVSPTKFELLWQYTNSIVVSRAWPKSSSANEWIARDERLFDGQRVASESNHRHPMPTKNHLF